MNKTCQFYLYFYFLLCFVFIYQTGFPFDKIHVKLDKLDLLTIPPKRILSELSGIDVFNSEACQPIKRSILRKQLTAVSRYLFSQSALSYTFERLLNTLEWCHCSNNRNDYSKGFRKYVIFLIQYLLFFNFTDAFQGWN